MSTPQLQKAFNLPLDQQGRIALEIATPETLRLRITQAESFQDWKSYAVIRDQWAQTNFHCSEKDGITIIKTKSLEIQFRLSPFLFTVIDHFGNIRFQMKDDGLQFKDQCISLTRELLEKECLYGLGEHGEAFNRVPGRYRIWNTDDSLHQPTKQFYANIPMGICWSGGATPPHGFFLDNPGELIFDVGMDDPTKLRIDCHTGDIDLWLFFEETPADILREYTNLTGRIERPPLWALGFQQCRWSYETEDRVKEVANEFRQRKIPCDVIYLDIHYMEKYRVFTWDEENFSDPENLLKTLQNQGFSTITIVDPGVAIANDYIPHDEGLEQEGFFLKSKNGEYIIRKVWPGEVYHPDFTSKTNREIWGKWQADSLLKAGISGIWNDMNEPAIFATTTEAITEDYPADALHDDNGHYRSHKEIHNIYGMTMAQASTEGQKAFAPERRPMTVTRSGWAGVQRYSSVWTGDNRSSFACMGLDIHLNLHLGMSGVPFVGCDIGGFIGNATPELFARWMEWGVLQPFCRAHTQLDSKDHEPWAFGPEVEAISRRLIELRYQLLPYLYTQFVDSSETGLPINRPLVLDYPRDATVGSIGNQFLLGPDIMIAPVLEAGIDHRSVYLPAGEWIHFFSNQRQEGGRWILAEAPLGQPPIFCRAGAVIPMAPIRQHTKEQDPDVTFLDVFPGKSLSGRLVEDDGATTAYENGEECQILFFGEEKTKGLSLFIGAPQGPYRSGRLFWTVRIHETKHQIESVECAGKSLEIEKIGGVTIFTIPDEKKPLQIDLSYGDPFG